MYTTGWGSPRHDLSGFGIASGCVRDRFGPCLIVTRYSKLLGSDGVAWRV